MCELGVLTLQAESDCQAVDAAAVSSLVFMLTSCKLNLDANTIISMDPVVGSNACETFVFDILQHSVSISAMTDCRSMRADETKICVVLAEEAGSLICTDESESQLDSSQIVHDVASFGEAPWLPKFMVTRRITCKPVFRHLVFKWETFCKKEAFKGATSWKTVVL